MPDSKFDLGDYVEVKDRIKLFYELYAGGRLVTAEVRWPAPDDDAPRIAVKALAYRTPDDPQPAVGWSWMALPGTTPYTKGSELENTETSAWGRAIAALGILLDRSIATGNEIRSKAGGERTVQPQTPSHEATGDGGLIGTVSVGDAPADYEFREEPDGMALSFKLMDGRKGFRVVARGDLAEALALVKSSVVGKRVTCWGVMGTASVTKNGMTINYNVLELERIETPDLVLPAIDELASLPMFADSAA